MISDWHQFVASTDDDSECVNPDCGVVVSDDCLRGYNSPCPAPPCTDGGNEGNACVIVRGERGPMCSYCERVQAFDEDEDSADLSAVLVDLPDEDLY